MRPAPVVALLVACALTAPAVGAANTPAPPKSRLALLAPQLAPAQRITHLLNRAAFGPSPHDVERLQTLGLDAWLDEQLTPAADPALDARLSGFKTMKLSVGEAMRAFPPLPERLKAAGIDPKSAAADGGRAAEREALGVMPEELPRQLLVEATQARLLRAIGSERQLEQVLVDFWFDHFNVSAEKGRVRWMISAYERDALRPHVFGRFRELLGAVAHHPAMLFYLDNWQSVRDGFEPRARAKRPDPGPKGLNENYARELLELHTLGVNAGYTQADVREAARALTGWSIELRPQQPNAGEFVFHAQAHDAGEKKVFGLLLPAGGGQDDGEKLLDFLAVHPATARFVARKLCVRFVSDAPPDALVERVAKVFVDTGGDLRATYRAIFESKEFWSPEAVGAKTKTPLEFVASAVRALGTIEDAERPLPQALEQLGAPLYRCAPPTGYAEVAAPWVSAGALVTRINFGLAVAAGRVKGVTPVLPPAGKTVEATVDAVAAQVLGRALTEATRKVVLRALAPREDDGAMDGEARKADPARIAGLLVGSPEFQKQ